MQFYIYENWTRDRGRVHLGHCSHCNFGLGREGEDSGRNGKWHGPFEDRAMAYKTAASLGRSDMKACAICNP